ncbi:hypothetical protein BH23PLA1_BH23PLA1_28040 [soil metagenome]
MLDLIYALFVFAVIGAVLLFALEALFGVPGAWNRLVRSVRRFLGLQAEGWPLRTPRNPTVDQPPDEEHDHDDRQRHINALPLSVARSRALHLLNDQGPFRFEINPDPNQPELLAQAPMLREFCARFDRVEAHIEGLFVAIGMQFLRELAEPPGHFIVGGFEGTPYLVRPGAEAIHVLQRSIPLRGLGPAESETRYEAASIYHLILILNDMIEEVGDLSRAQA